jgi:transcriptional regulator with XRE-family HTH domain
MPTEIGICKAIGVPDFPLKKLLRARGVSQAELAQASGISREYICRLASGKVAPGWRTICIIAATMNLSLGDFDANER